MTSPCCDSFNGPDKKIDNQRWGKLNKTSQANFKTVKYELSTCLWHSASMIQITSKPRLCQRNAFNDSRAASNNTLHSKTHRESLDAKEHRTIAHSHLLETISMKPRGWIDDMIQPGGYTYEYTLSCMNTTLQHIINKNVQTYYYNHNMYSSQNYR